MSTDPRAARRRAVAGLAAVRADGRHRALVVFGGVLVGLGLGSLHWAGLVLGGVLVALPARTPARGLAHGLGLGGLGLLAFAGLLARQGALDTALASGTVIAVAVGVGLAAPVLGASVRAVV